MIKISSPRMRHAGRWFAGAALSVILSGAAQAHSFSVAIIADEAGGAGELAAAVRGFLVASAERDGHSNETADGHLGGLDVFLTPLPAAQTSGIEGLVGQVPETFDIVVVLGEPTASADVQGVAATTIVIAPGALPDAAQRTSFAERFVGRFDIPPTEAAALGYNAARRIDVAVRRFGGTAQPDALRSALADTAGGMTW